LSAKHQDISLLSRIRAVDEYLETHRNNVVELSLNSKATIVTVSKVQANKVRRAYTKLNLAWALSDAIVNQTASFLLAANVDPASRSSSFSSPVEKSTLGFCGRCSRNPDPNRTRKC
jgi:hypothetical protein